MLADPLHAHAAPADVAYTKTVKGRDEVAQRRGGLTSRQRSILIMLDGQKSVDALGGLMPADQVRAILGELCALGLIAPASEKPAPTPAPAADEGRLAPVKDMMRRTAMTCLGPMAAELVRQIDAANDESGLQRALAHWHMAMQASKYGKDVAEQHLASIRASLQEVFAAH